MSKFVSIQLTLAAERLLLESARLAMASLNLSLAFMPHTRTVTEVEYKLKSIINQDFPDYY